MTDILSMVQDDEASFPLDIMGRKDDKAVPTGVTFQVRDLGNRDTQAALKRERNKALGKRLRTKEDMEDEDMGAMASMATTDPTDEMLAHCVTAWDWGDNTLGKYKTEYNHANVVAVLAGVPWIRQQVLAKALEVSGFTKA